MCPLITARGGTKRSEGERESGGMAGLHVVSSRGGNVSTQDRGGGRGTKWIKERAKVYTHVLL